MVVYEAVFLTFGGAGRRGLSLNGYIKGGQPGAPIPAGTEVSLYGFDGVIVDPLDKNRITQQAKLVLYPAGQESVHPGILSWKMDETDAGLKLSAFAGDFEPWQVQSTSFTVQPDGRTTEITARLVLFN